MDREIDLKDCSRKATYEFFKDYRDPFFNFTANVDVTELYDFCRIRKLSFSLAALWVALQAANSIPEFRTRLRDGRIIEFSEVQATQTILNDDDTFSFSYYENRPNVIEFVNAGQAATAKYKELKTFDVESDRLDLIYFSVIPWVSFTSFKHASRLERTLTIPRIVFGRFFSEGQRQKMPLSVEANHMVMDGLHVGRFFNSFEELARRSRI